MRAYQFFQAYAKTPTNTLPKRNEMQIFVGTTQQYAKIIHIRKALVPYGSVCASQLARIEGIALLDVAAVDTAAEPAHPLRRATVRE